MPELGQFLEISIPTANVQESLTYYRRLGFAELLVGDVRDYHYAVVSDGSVCIGLHGASIDEISLSFVRPDLIRHSRSLRETGITLDFERLDDDEFNEAGVSDPDGHPARMLEARTFSPGIHEELPRPVTGPLVALRLTCARLERSLEFWEQFGFELADAGPGRIVRVRTAGLELELCEGPRRQPALGFRPASLERCLSELEQRQITAADHDDRYVLTAPEGTELLIDSRREPG